MTKRLSIVCLIIFSTGVMANVAFATPPEYKAGADTMSLDLGLPATTCDTRTVSLDGSTFGTSPLVSGGFLITLSDTTTVEITDCQCYDGTLTPAVWDAGGMAVYDPIGYDGGLFFAATNLGVGVAVPSDDILVCDVEFCGIAKGSSDITVQTVPDFDTWVAQDFTVYDAGIDPAVINVTVTVPPICGNGEVEAGEQCDDGNTTPGDCCSALCAFETAGSPCDDGEFCTDGDICNGAGVCQSGADNPCDAGLKCDEDANECVQPPCTISINPATPSVELLGTVQFNPVIDGTCDSEPCYLWEITTQASAGSTIDPITGQYTAGNSEGTDIITVTDDCNYAISADTQVVVVSEPCDVDEDCDDSNECTADTCPAGTCVYTPVENGTPCDDGLFCTDVDTCTNGICGGTTRDCSAAGDQCNDGVCNEDADVCEPSPKADGTLCEDGLFCTVPDVCQGGVCQEGEGTPCDSLGLICSEGDNGCLCSEDTECDDGLYCNGVEACGEVICEPGTPVECADDGLYCTGDEVCDEATDACVSTGNPCPPATPICAEGAEGPVCSRPPVTTTTSIPSTTTTVEPITTTTTSIGPTTTTTSIPGAEPSIDLIPASLFQSRWFPILRRLRIEGTDTSFVRRQSAVTFQPANAILKFPPFVVDSDTIMMLVYVMPKLLTGPVDSVTATVITGSESASGELGIELLPFFLEERQGELE